MVPTCSNNHQNRPLWLAASWWLPQNRVLRVNPSLGEKISSSSSRRTFSRDDANGSFSKFSRLQASWELYNIVQFCRWLDATGNIVLHDFLHLFWRVVLYWIEKYVLWGFPGNFAEFLRKMLHSCFLGQTFLKELIDTSQLLTV